MFYIIYNVLAVSALTGFMAFVLVLADGVFANYGECNVNINGKKNLKVQGGSSLLSLLSANGIFIPSACGGKGTCGFCKVKIYEGADPLLPTEKPYLDENEINNSVRLSCQVKVKRDIKIEIPESLFNIRKYKTRVKAIVDYTYDIKGITLQLLEPAEIEFRAGQYVQLEAPKYEKIRQRVSRAYSISSCPADKDIIQLIIRKVPDGIVTTYVHHYLNVGDEVNFTGPFGDFFIRDTEADMIFTAGGSGKAPFKSIIEDLYNKGCKRNIIYFFGARTSRDIYLTDFFREYEKKMPNFKYIPVLSQPDENDDWEGLTGYIPPFYGKYIQNAENTEAYLCGSPGMIAAAERELTRLGIKKIYYDSFN